MSMAAAALPAAASPPNPGHSAHKRLDAIDAIRGVLAFLVVIYHLDVAFGQTRLNILGLACVFGFFILSGYVLAKTYDGRPLVFVVRRIVRLWPLYAVCVTIAHAVAGERVALHELLWWPMPPGIIPADPPAWSLYWEAWASPVLPIAFAIAKASRQLMLILAAAFFLLLDYDVGWGSGLCLGLGVALAQYPLRWPERLPGVTLWLGRISFSLYLTHAVVMRLAFNAAGPYGVVASLPVVFLVAHATWWAVERPSIEWSRVVGRALSRKK